jgi:hypothetical protein
LEKFEVRYYRDKNNSDILIQSIYKISEEGNMQVTYFHENGEVDIILNDFKAEDKEKMYKKSIYWDASTKVNVELELYKAMNVELPGGGFQSKYAESHNHSLFVGEQLSYTLDINISFKPDKTEFKKEDLESDFLKVKTALQNYASWLKDKNGIIEYKDKYGRDRRCRIGSNIMIVGYHSPETSGYKGCGNTCLAQDRSKFVAQYILGLYLKYGIDANKYKVSTDYKVGANNTRTVKIYLTNNY